MRGVTEIVLLGDIVGLIVLAEKNPDAREPGTPERTIRVPQSGNGPDEGESHENPEIVLLVWRSTRIANQVINPAPTMIAIIATEIQTT